MDRGPIGKKVLISSIEEKCYSFLPNPLPVSFDLNFDQELQDLLINASNALGQLDGVSMMLPNIDHILYGFIRQEAVLSSQIEGTQSSLSDLLVFEKNGKLGVPIDDVQEVSNYVAALNYGIKRIDEGFPICNRLLKEIHGILLSKGRGSEKNPGEFRKSQNWIGGNRPGNAYYVPPPSSDVGECMSNLEKFIHNSTMPIILKSAFAHLQFETIHPFLDGNGRLGRLLITLMLYSTKIIKQPIFYISLYFKTNRSVYYDLLQHVRLTGDWESWLKFFLRGVHLVSFETINTSRNILKVFEEDEARIKSSCKSLSSVLPVFYHFKKNPISSIREASEILNISTPTLNSVVKQLLKINVLSELTNQERYRLFAYTNYLSLINSQTTNPFD